VHLAHGQPEKRWRLIIDLQTKRKAHASQPVHGCIDR
jgi:hypothetical protein